MSLLSEVIEDNGRWVEERSRPVGKVPQKKVVIFTCMDTRLIEFLEPALGLRRGDATLCAAPGCGARSRSSRAS